MLKRYFHITPDDFEVAKRNGLTEKIVKERVYRLGWDIDSSINKPKRRMKEKTVFTSEDKYIIVKNGLTTRNVTERMYQGWTKEKAINTPKLDKTKNLKPRNKYKYTNQETEIAKKNGINKGTFYKRIANKWTVEEAFTIPINGKINDKSNHIWNKYEKLRIEGIKRNDRRNVL